MSNNDTAFIVGVFALFLAVIGLILPTPFSGSYDDLTDIPAITDGLVLWMPFDYEVGNVSDFSGYMNHGVVTQNVTYVNGKFGKGFFWDGASGYITIPDSNSLDLTELTFSCWLKRGVLTGFRDILDKSLGSVRNYRINYSPSAIRVEFHDSSNVRHIWESAVLLNSSVFHHLVVTLKNSSAYIFVDGLEYSGSWIMGDGIGVPKINSDSLYIAYPVGNWFDGVMDDIRVYNRVLGATEVLALYNLP